MVKWLKLTILNDNEPGKGLKNDWGWSILLESEKWRILFDANTDPDVIEYNADKMDIDLEHLSFAFLSHYHADHYGGFEYVGNVTSNLKIYTPPGDSKLLRSWGLKTIEIEKTLKLDVDLWSSGPLGPIEEQALGVKVENVGLIAVVGCSHPGVDKLAYKLKDISKEKIYLVIGGYHSPSHEVLDSLATFSRYICPSHCSGSDAKNYVKMRYPEKYYQVKTGTHIEITKEGIK